MRQFTAALFSDALGLLRALFTPPRGRHTRRRSTRVRRYAAAPPRAARPRPPATAASTPRPRPPAAPRLAAPRQAFPAEDLALVRRYYTAHEQDRIQAAATARLARWTGPRIPAPRPPEGDLLAPTPAPATAPATAAASALIPAPAPAPDLATATALAPASAPAGFEDLADLAGAVRRWQTQQHQQEQQRPRAQQHRPSRQHPHHGRGHGPDHGHGRVLTGVGA